MTRSLRFLKVSHVIRLHREGLDTWGGQDGIRDSALLDSAVAMPQQSFGGEYLHSDLFAMAAAYAFHIAQNQPFIDGNKRAGTAAAFVFLRMHDIRCDPSADELLYNELIRVSKGELSKEGLADVLRGLAISM